MLSLLSPLIADGQHKGICIEEERQGTNDGPLRAAEVDIRAVAVCDQAEGTVSRSRLLFARRVILGINQIAITTIPLRGFRVRSAPLPRVRRFQPLATRGPKRLATPDHHSHRRAHWDPSGPRRLRIRLR